LQPELEFIDRALPILPQTRLVLLPHVRRPLHVFEPRHVRLVEDAVQDKGVVGVVRFEPGWEADYLKQPDVRKTGCAASIHDLRKLPDGHLDLELLGLRKFEIIREVRKKPYRAAEVQWILDANAEATDRRATEHVHRIVDVLDRITRAQGEIPSQIRFPPDLPFAGVVKSLAVTAGLTEEELDQLLDLHDTYVSARAVERILKARLEVRRQAGRKDRGS
jgi:Lon protease-like protein